jgi:hypothetical protein
MVARLIPDEVTGFIYLQPNNGTGVYSASNRNEYKKIFPGTKRGRHARLTTSPPTMNRLSRQRVIFDILKTYRPPESRECGRRDPSRWPRGTLHPQKLALVSLTSSGRSVDRVCSRTQATQFRPPRYVTGRALFFFFFILFIVCTVSFIVHAA